MKRVDITPIFKKEMDNGKKNYRPVSMLSTFLKVFEKLEGSLDRVLFAAELEFPKILVPRLPQNASNVNIEGTGKGKQP